MPTVYERTTSDDAYKEFKRAMSSAGASKRLIDAVAPPSPKEKREKSDKNNSDAKH